MKLQKIIITLCLFFNLLGANFVAQTLKGKIKHVNTSNIHYDDDGKIVINDKNETFYDSNGKIIKSCTYDKSGEISDISKYKNGELIKRLGYNKGELTLKFVKKDNKEINKNYKNGKVIIYSNERFEKDGKLIEVNTYAFSKKNSTKIIYKYNSERQAIEIKTYYNKKIDKIILLKYNKKGQKILEDITRGKENEKIFFEYNNKGQEIEKRKVYKGKVYYKEVSKYEGENLIEECSFENGKWHTKNTYKYNEKGNIIEVAYHHAYNKNVAKIVFMYDKKGNKIRELGYNEFGKLKREEIFIYDLNGNWIEHKRFNLGRLDMIIKRSIEYLNN